MKVTSTPKAPAAIGPYSQAISANGFLFTSGQIAIIPETGEIDGTTIEAQADRVCNNLKALLEANGLAPAATDAEASEHQRKLAAEGIVYTGPFEEKEEACHAERSEASPATNGEILRGSAPQNDSHAATIRF